MKQYSVLVLISLVIGCATNGQQEAMRSISIGMTKDEVLTRLGAPDQEWTGNEMVVMHYDIYTPDTGKMLQCVGAGLNGQQLPGCNSESYSVRYFIQIKDNIVAAYGRIQNNSSLGTQGYSNSTYTPQEHEFSQGPLAPEPASPEPSFNNFACKDAIRRYKLGAISINQMENACQ